MENVEIETVYENPVSAPLTLPQTQPKPKPKAETQPRAVFGQSRNAITSDDASAPEFKAGNTVAKAPDQERLAPSDADSLPIPTEEYLVSRMPELLTDLRAPYPPEARKAGVQGAVIMDLLIDSEGNVREAKLISGPGSGLNEAALEAARKLKFRPALVEKNQVAVRIRYSYRFVLEK